MPLNRNFFSLAVFAAALHTALLIVAGIVYFMMGHSIYGLGIFFKWNLFVNAFLFLTSFVYVKYFHLKKYTLPFWAMLLNIFTSTVSFVVFIGATNGKPEWAPFYTITETITLAATILLGLALIISVARERYWLKLAGIFFIVYGITLLVPLLWYLRSMSPDKAVTLETVVKWLLLAGFAGPLMLMKNFMDEQKKLLPPDENLPLPLAGENLINSIKFIFVLGAIFFSFTIIGQAISRVSFDRRAKSQSEHWEQVWGSRIFVGTRGDTVRYQFIPPKDYDSTRTYPMVVCLPYGGGIEGAPPAKFLMEEENRIKYPSFVFVPFCSKGIGWGGIPNYPTMDTLVFEAIEAVEKDFNSIDADRVYISGVSRGGYGSWHFISLRPDLFAAAMPVCGAGDPGLANNVVNVAVWAFHGEDDPGVPVSGSRDMIAAIKSAGGNPKYTEFENSGHDIWHFVTQTPGAFEWLFEQRKQKSDDAPNR